MDTIDISFKDFVSMVPEKWKSEIRSTFIIGVRSGKH